MASVQRGKKRLMGEINVVPYIDVMLVLLIIFMITAPLLTQGIKVELPKAAAEPLVVKDPKNDKPLVLSIDEMGRLFLNIGGDPATPIDEQTLFARTAAMIRRAPDIDILVRGDAQVPYGRVVSAMVVLQRAGAAKIGFVTDPAPQNPKRK